MDKSKIWSHFGGPNRRERERGEEKREEEEEEGRGEEEDQIQVCFQLGIKCILIS